MKENLPLKKSNKDIPLPHAFPYLTLLGEHRLCSCEPLHRLYCILQDVISGFEKNNWNRGRCPASQHHSPSPAAHELSLSILPGTRWQHRRGRSGINLVQVRNDFGLISKNSGSTYITETSYNSLLLLAEFGWWNKTRNAKLKLRDQAGQVTLCGKLQHICPALGHLPGFLLLRRAWHHVQ